MAEKYYSGMASEIASKGRYGDSTLMHVNPIELEGLASLGPVTVNPHTGLPEAFAWTLPMILAAAGAVGGGIYGGVTAKKRGQGLAEGILGGLALGGLGGYSVGGLGAAGGLWSGTAPAFGATGGGGALASQAPAAVGTQLASQAPALGLEGAIGSTGATAQLPNAAALQQQAAAANATKIASQAAVPMPITSPPGTPPLGNFDPSGVMAAEGTGFTPTYGMDNPAIFNPEATVLEGAQALGGGEGTGIAQQVGGYGPTDIPPGGIGTQGQLGVGSPGTSPGPTVYGSGDVRTSAQQAEIDEYARLARGDFDPYVDSRAGTTGLDDTVASMRADELAAESTGGSWFEEGIMKPLGAVGTSIKDNPLPWALGTAFLAESVFGGDGGDDRDSGEDVVYTGEFASDVESGGRGERVYPVGEIPADSSAERRYVFPYARA